MSPIWKVSLRLRSPRLARERARTHTEVCWLRAHVLNCSAAIFLFLTQVPKCPEFPEECYASVRATLQKCNVTRNMRRLRRNQVIEVVKAMGKNVCKSMEAWDWWELGYIGSWEWRGRMDLQETGLYPMLRSLDISCWCLLKFLNPSWILERPTW